MPVYGVIDVGSNAIKFKIARCDPPAHVETLCEEREPVRLGAGVFRGEPIPRATIDVTVEAFLRFRKLFELHGVEEARAVATSAMREAPNGEAVLAELAERTGVTLEVISGSEEARLIQLGTSLDLGGGAGGGAAGGASGAAAATVLFVDIGGGSCELSVREGDEARELVSLPLGAVRLTETFVSTDPISNGEHRRLKDLIYSEIRENTSRMAKRSFDLAVGTAGTINAICESILAQRDLYPESTPTAIRYADISAFHRRLRGMTLDERRALPEITGNRADILIAGAAVLKYVLKTFRPAVVRASRHGLKDGVLLDLLARRTHGGPLESEFHRERLGALVRFGERFQFDRPHAEHVAQLAMRLFDQLRGAHGLGDEERNLLEAAAIVHAVGRAVNVAAMHKHSYYIIKNAELTGFTQDEIAVIANVARYHRRGEPNPRHENFAPLAAAQREVVRWLAAILRVADGLDRHADGRVRDVAARDGDALTLTLDADRDADLAVWSSQRKAGLLERMIGKPVEYAVKVVNAAP